jgi:acyl-CoA dehydrogenase
LVEEVLIPAEPRTAADDRIPDEALAALRAHGLFGISIPEEHGGLGLTMEEEAELMLVLGRAAPAYRARYALNSGAAAQILLRAGTEAQRRRWLPGAAAGDIVLGFALSEPEAGSDAAALRTTARRDGGGWVVAGRKRWVTNAPEAGLFMVLARTGGEGARGVSAFAVPADAPGVEVQPAQGKMGLRGAHVADVVFRDAGRLRPADAAAAKLFATEAACRVADRVLQVHGGEGYMEGSAIERLYRDVRLFRILDGTSEIQRVVVARGLLGPEAP